MINYLSPETAIEARLNEAGRLPDGWRVLVAANLEGVLEKNQPTPAVHVLFLGESEIQSEPGGRVVYITQLWGTVLVDRNLRDLQTYGSAREDLSPVIPQVLGSLMGWSPAEGFSALEPVRAPLRLQYRNGYAYFPYAFITRLQLRKTE